MTKPIPHFCHDPAVKDFIDLKIDRPAKLIIRPDHAVWVGQIDPWTFIVCSGPNLYREEGSLYLFCEKDKLEALYKEIGEMLSKITEVEMLLTKNEKPKTNHEI